MWVWRYGVSVFFEAVCGHGEGPGWSRDEGRAREWQGPWLERKGPTSPPPSSTAFLAAFSLARGLGA
jgi:hypothetical protein